jgi:parvulin-like peptidyl-prolyl isomerase
MFSRARYILILAFSLALGLSACGSLFGTPATPTPELPTSTPVPPTPTPPPLAAIVNGDWITEKELQAEVERYRVAQLALGREVSTDEAAEVVLDDLISLALLAQAARADGFEITETELQSRIDALAAQVGGADALSKWQSEQGYTDESFRSALKRAAEAAWMRDKIIATVPETADQVHAQQILLYNEVAAREVADQLSAGSAFAELAALYDPNTRGDLGWFPRGYLLEPELEKAAFSLQPGQHSDVIASEVGYHILMVLERDPQYPLSPDAYLAMQERALKDWLQQKREEGNINPAP